jgi:arylamine N-acetyltransferase
VDGATYHVDVGYGGPFREPIPLDRMPYEIVEGADRYIFDRDGLAVYTNGNREHGYTVNDTPRSREFFTGVMLDSFEPAATFMNNLRICRIFKDHSLSLFNRSLRIHRGTETIALEIETRTQMAFVIAEQMQLPKLPWEEAVAFLEKATGKPFFALTSSASGSPHPR